MSVQAAIGNAFQNPMNQLIPQCSQLLCCFLHFSHCQLRSLAQTNDTRNIFCTRTQLLFLCAAENQRRNPCSLADINRADALRCAQLMPTHGQQINMQLFYINRHMTNSLYRICVEQNTVLFRNFSNFCDRLNRTDFVIRKHNGNQNGFGTDGIFQLLQRNLPEFVYVQISHIHTLCFQKFCGMQNRMMFNFCCNNMFFLFLACVYHATQCHIVAFRTACCEINFIGCRTNRSRYLCPCCLQRLFTFLCNAVNAGCIAVIFSEVRKNLLQYLLPYGCCCCVIKIIFCRHKNTPLNLFIYHSIFICFM